MNPVLAASIALLLAVPAGVALNPQMVANLYSQAQSEFPSAFPSSSPSASPSPIADVSPDPLVSASPIAHHHHHHHHAPAASPSPIAYQSAAPIVTAAPATAAPTWTASPAPANVATAAPPAPVATIWTSSSSSPAAVAPQVSQQVPAPIASPPLQPVNPGPLPSVSPIAAGPYPIYSQFFTGNSPFKHTAAELLAAGATVRPSIVAQNYWGQPLNSVHSDGGAQLGGPYVVSAAGSPTYTFQCPAYGGCNANGKPVSYPSGASPTSDGDHHLEVLDLVHAQEVDGWGGLGGGCAIGGGSVNCSSGGVFPFSGDCLAHGGSANAFGAAFGCYLVAPREIAQGHIDHALGILQACEDGASVYPAQPRKPDVACQQTPNIAYGDLIHLKDSVNVASLGYGRTCTIVAQALQKYGGYTIDSSGGRTVLFDAPSGNSAQVWYGFILPEMVASGDATMNGKAFSFPGCLQRISASQIEVIRLNQGGDSALPPLRRYSGALTRSRPP
jgi:hypothetical protein